MLLRKLKLIAAFLTIAGCSSVTVKTDPIPLPVSPELPAITAQELECLSQDTFEAMVLREQTLRSYITTLQELILTTHE